MRKFYYICIIFISLSALWQCARRGSPTGGPKDETPPVLLNENPKSGTTNFNQKKIRLTFDELVTTKDLRKQLIISPPMQSFPIFSPISASKWIEIKIEDTLKPNTTYVFNFGNSIQDYNEGNPLTDLKYVFSTGKHIDSLKINGKMKDALKAKPDNFVTIMLYENNDNYTDSLVYKNKPTYVTSTLDSLETFELNYLKEGSYVLVALKDKNNNYLFDQKEDKIAFLDKPISIPNDSIQHYELTLFKEKLNYKAMRPVQISDTKIAFGFEGGTDSVQIKPISPVSNDFKYIISKEEKRDTLNFFFSPKQADSLVFSVMRNQKIDTLKVRLRKMKADSLQIEDSFSGNLPIRKHFSWKTNIPLTQTDSTKIKIINKDSLEVPFKTKLSREKTELSLIFDKKYDETYHIEALPNAIIDFFGNTNDTLKVNLKTPKLEDYSILKLSVNKKLNFPIIIQLIDERSQKVQYEMFQQKPQNQYVFENVSPNKYTIRVIEDQNGNQIWDTGNFLKRLQPEKIIYYPKPVELRANWEVEEIWNETDENELSSKKLQNVK